MSTVDKLFHAIRAGDVSTVDLLVRQQPELLHQEDEGLSPIRAAVYAGQGDLAVRISRLGAVPDFFDAAATGASDTLRSMISRDPDLVFDYSKDGFTALHLTAWFGHGRSVELLLSKGADPTAVADNATSMQPLHAAVNGGHVRISHLLLDRGADVDATQSGRVTALHIAAYHADTAMVEALLDRGANPRLRTADGKSPKDLTTGSRLRNLLS